ncbi:O-methyltransferase family 3 protein [Phanerochaete sordida]|uniref:O-methyltransferase family 3 protein n=1 Tax=Phanerochaete sordida TaxID=48140 RepID=A0A9P3GDN7_9APHY|nr:O-methyltransferase family 3 protein [Phanerochaete sordida]
MSSTFSAVPARARFIDDNWVRSDQYHNKFLLKDDAALEHALQNSTASGLPPIAVSAAQGKLLYLLAKTTHAKRVLEVGTLGGYSTIWFGRALPEDGRIVTLELEEKHAKVARQNFEHAGLASKIEVRVGPAADSLKELPSSEPFDLVFIDADKPNNPTYYKEARRLTRKGSVIIVDNVVRAGLVADPAQEGEFVDGVRELLRDIQADAGVEATTLATVGEKGYDGFTYILVL